MLTSTMAPPSNQEAMADCHAVDHDLPANWTCHDAGDVCISLRSSQAAYCCPHGIDCTHIACIPVHGQIWGQHYGKMTPNPRVFIKDINFTVEMCDEVNEMGCPLGYHCLIPAINRVPDYSCRINGAYAKTPNKDSASEASVVVTLPTPAATGMVSFCGGPTPSAGQDSNNTAASDKNSSHDNASLIAGATIGGAVGILALVLLVMIYLRYIKKHANQEASGNGQQDKEYWSFDGRKDAQGKSLSRWSHAGADVRIACIAGDSFSLRWADGWAGWGSWMIDGRFSKHTQHRESVIRTMQWRFGTAVF